MYFCYASEAVFNLLYFIEPILDIKNKNAPTLPKIYSFTHPGLVSVCLRSQ